MAYFPHWHLTLRVRGAELFLSRDPGSLSAMQAADEDEWWWCRSGALSRIAAALDVCHFAVIDDFLPSAEIDAMRQDVEEAYRRGLLRGHGLTGGGREGHRKDQAVLDKSVRGDVFCFFDNGQWVLPGTEAEAEVTVAKEHSSDSMSRTLDKMVRVKWRIPRRLVVLAPLTLLLR
jgi:hypothetical protein